MAIAVNKIDQLPYSEVMISSSSSLRTWMESIDLLTRTGTGNCLGSVGWGRRNQERGQRKKPTRQHNRNGLLPTGSGTGLLEPATGTGAPGQGRRNQERTRPDPHRRPSPSTICPFPSTSLVLRNHP